MTKLRLPGLIDAHVHLREPGAVHKEDFASGTRAAVKGGFTYVLDMPNNPQPTVTSVRLKQKIALVKRKAVCNVGFHFGTNGRNLGHFSSAWKNSNVFGLKVYCNHTTGEMLVEDLSLLEKIFASWRSKKPILVHAEGVQLAGVIALAGLYKRRLHVCHIALENEVELVRKAKAAGYEISAGVCPHHLFLTKGMAVMKPPLGTKKDKEALWKGLKDGTIDLVETDHAPHTVAEKKRSSPAFGVPGLETALGLMFLAVKRGLVSKGKVRKLLYDNPKRIFNIPDQDDTYIELDPDKSYIAGKNGYESKCNRSPFDGWKLYGEVETVVLRGKEIIKEGKIVV